MGKHADADAKLHTPEQLRPNKNIPQNPKFSDNSAPQVPPKGTNANNQYR
jgi:hypothetical protein